MSTPLLVLVGGATVAGTLLMGRVGLRAFHRFQNLPKLPKGFRNLPKGGFDTRMTRANAARIVQIKYPHPRNPETSQKPGEGFVQGRMADGSERNISRAKLAERYKSVMLANHPDRGGSPYLALKINEARKVLSEFAR